MSARLGRGAFWVGFLAVTTMTVVWLVVGALVTTPLNEPPGQAVVDYLASAVNLVVAAVLLRHGAATWTTRLLALAMVGSAGAFNLQAHAATLTVREATGLEIGELHQVLLHGVAGGAYAGALLLFTGGASRRRVVVPVVAVVLFVAGFGTALLPHTVSCVVFFGFGVPLLGVLAVGPAVRRAATPETRARARLLTSVLVAALGSAVVLALLTVVLAALSRPGLTLDDPTARHGGLGATLPIALLFWFARITAAVIALAVLAAGRARAAERWLHRGLAALVAIVALGGLAVLVATLVGSLVGGTAGTVIGNLVAIAAVAALWLPVSARTDRLAERLLYGTRATPAGVLARISELARRGADDPGDLDRVPEAVGRALGARAVRLTAHRDGLRDRVTAWREPDAGDEEVVFAIRHGDAEVGHLAVDAETLAGGPERRRLVADVADGLGGVLAAHRLEIELERQLRVALAHAERIAAGRRGLVAEMDSERRGIERNLHDGAQHHLVSLRLTLGLVEHLAGAGRLEQVRERLDLLVSQLDTAEAVLAETAGGVSSATLSRLGLVATLEADLAGMSGATLTAEEVGRYDEAVETAAYFCALEAVNNARKHAGGAPVHVRLSVSGGALHVRVADDGPGFDPATSTGPGRGMRNLTARLAAVGGWVTVGSAPGEGTTVTAEIPLPVPDGVEAHGAARPVPDEPATGLVEAFVASSGTAARDRRVASDDRVAAGARALIAGLPGPPPARDARDDRDVHDDTRLLAVVPALGAPGAAPAVPDVGPPLPPSGSAFFDAALALVRRADEELPVGHPDAPAVRTLAARYGAPWRIGVTGPTPHDAAAVAGALGGFCPRPAVMVDLAARAALGPITPDEVVDVLVLLAEDEAGPRVPAWLAAVPTVGARVVPAVSVNVDDPLTDTVRIALPGPGATGGKNLGRLAAIITDRRRPRAARRRARAALGELEALAGRSAGAPWGRRLLFEIERVRAAGAQELAEEELADDLAAGRVVLPAARRDAAARLLGGEGASPRARLGLEAAADPAELSRVAREQRAGWQRLAAHPAASRAVRDAAEVLAAACEALPESVSTPP